jgi:hypothetical protein
MSFEPINIEDTQAVKELREMLKVVGDALSEAQGEVEELRELNAELLGALKRLNSEYGRQDEDALEQAELVIAKAEKLK